MADKNQPGMMTMLHEFGFITRADITERFATGDAPGRADIMVARGGRSCMVECKYSENGFDLDEWRDNQREWSDIYCSAAPFSTQYWLCLTLGSDRAGLDQTRFSPKRSWLVPREFMLEVDKRFRPIQKTIPYRVGPGYSLELQAKGWDAIKLFASFELPWGKLPSEKSGWTVPSSHIFYQMYVAPPALPMFLDLYPKQSDEESQNGCSTPERSTA